MVFTSSQAETQGPLEESCCGEAGRLRRQQHSTRMEADTQHTELRIMQRCGLAFIWNAAVPLLPYSLGALLPLLGWHSKHADCSTAGWISEETIHPGPAARGCGPRAPGVGAVPTVDTSLLALEGPMGLHRYLQAANKVICSSSCSLSTDGGTPRAEDYFWLAISDCSCLSQPRWATALCCQPWEQVLLLRRTSSNPRCQHRGALCLLLGRTNFSSTTLHLLHPGKIRNLEGLFLGSEEL